MSLPVQHDSNTIGSTITPSQARSGHKVVNVDSQSPAQAKAIEHGQKTPATKEPISVGSVRSIQGSMELQYLYICCEAFGCFVVLMLLMVYNQIFNIKKIKV